MTLTEEAVKSSTRTTVTLTGGRRANAKHTIGTQERPRATPSASMRAHNQRLARARPSKTRPREGPVMPRGGDALLTGTRSRAGARIPRRPSRSDCRPCISTQRLRWNGDSLSPRRRWSEAPGSSARRRSRRRRPSPCRWRTLMLLSNSRWWIDGNLSWDESVMGRRNVDGDGWGRGVMVVCGLADGKCIRLRL